MEIDETSNIAGSNLLPEKSKHKYEQTYEYFKTWLKMKNENISENVMLAYLREREEKLKSPASMWTEYSILKATICYKDKINISNFPKLLAYLKSKNYNYNPKKFRTLSKREIIKFFREAPDVVYLFMKTIMVMGFTGACRIEELCKMQLPHITDNGKYFIIKIPDSETGRQRAFIIANNPDESINYLEIFRKYYEIRKRIPNNPRFFLRYQLGRCVNQPVGKHTFGRIPSQIAKFLKLPDADLYSWRCFRRSSASSLEKSGVNILGLKRHRNLESSTITDSYVAESISNQLEPVNKTLYNQSKEYFKNVLDNLKIEQPDEINQHIDINEIDDPIMLENSTIWPANSPSPSLTDAYSVDETLDTQDIPMEDQDGIQNANVSIRTNILQSSTSMQLNGYKEEMKSDIEGPYSELEEDDRHNHEQELHRLRLKALQNRIIHEEELHAQKLKFNEEKHQLEMELLRIKVDKEKNN